MIPVPLPVLQNKFIRAEPLQPQHFDELYAAGSDPAIWEQHPNPNRWQQPAFKNYFDGGIESTGAYLVRDAATNEVIGSSRFSDYNSHDRSVHIGYTFFITRCWGQPYNYSLKKLMLDEAMRFADAVLFFIGAANIRSQKSIEKLGAKKIREEEMAYFGEGVKLNYVYCIKKDEWQTLRNQPLLAAL